MDWVRRLGGDWVVRRLTGHPWPLKGGGRLLQGRLGHWRVGEHCGLSLAVRVIRGRQHWSDHALVGRVALNLFNTTNRAR